MQAKQECDAIVVSMRPASRRAAAAMRCEPWPFNLRFAFVAGSAGMLWAALYGLARIII